MLVLDNGSRDGSAEAGAGAPGGGRDDRARAPPRQGRQRLASCCARARGRYALLLNEDSELAPGATLALWRALREHPRAALRRGAAAAPRRASRSRRAWRFPSPATALAFALGLQPALVVQSRGEEVRAVDWCQSSALLVRREAAAQVDYLDPDFFVYSDEVDFARRLRDAGWRSAVRARRRVAVHHEQLSNDPRRRPRADRRDWPATATCYMRKHHSPAAARAVRWLTAWAYALRALAALAVPGHSAAPLLAHVAAPCARRAARACARRPNATTAAKDRTNVSRRRGVPARRGRFGAGGSRETSGRCIRTGPS